VLLNRCMVSSMDSLHAIEDQARGFLLGAVCSLHLLAGALLWSSSTSRLAPRDTALSASRSRLAVSTSDSDEQGDVQLRARTRRGDVGVDSSEEDAERLVAVLSLNWPSRASEMRPSYCDLRWNRCPPPLLHGSLILSTPSVPQLRERISRDRRGRFRDARRRRRAVHTAQPVCFRRTKAHLGGPSSRSTRRTDRGKIVFRT
jgi:hypothetical protein